MLDHLEIHSRRIADCVGFYRSVLSPLGYVLAVEGDQKGFGHEGRLDFWIGEGEPSRDVHYAFSSPDRDAVLRAFEASDVHGGRKDRPPMLAPHIHPHYFAGYARDPDGRLVEFVCHLPELNAARGSTDG